MSDIYFGEYIRLAMIGSGAFATVYKVRHNAYGHIRALKVLDKPIVGDEKNPIKKKFMDECKLLLRLGNGSHPNIVRICRPLVHDEHAAIEMDLIDGNNLGDYIKEHNNYIETKEVLRLLCEISSALAYCHVDIYKYCMDRTIDNLKDDPKDGSKVLIDAAKRKELIEKYRIVHNDIHSGNIMRRTDGSYMLLDFGLSIEGGNLARSSQRRNGAPEYKAPEKWNDDKLLLPQSDIYSFGITLYEYLTGRVPFILEKNGSKAESILCISHETKTPPSIYDLRKAAFERTHSGKTYKKDYPDWLEALIMKCLEKSPKDRFQDGKELYTYVKECMEKEYTTHSKNSDKSNQNEKITKLQKEVDSKTEELQKVKSELKMTESKLAALRVLYNTVYKEKRDLENENKTLKQQINPLKKWRVLFWLAVSILSVAVLVLLGNNTTTIYPENLEQIAIERDSLKKVDKIYQNEIVKLGTEISVKTVEIANLKSEIAENKKTINNLKDNSKLSNQETIDKYEKQLSAKDNTIKNLNSDISTKQTKITNLSNQVQTLSNEVARLRASGGSSSYQQIIEAKNATIKQLNSEIVKLKKENSDQKNLINILNKQLL